MLEAQINFLVEAATAFTLPPSQANLDSATKASFYEAIAKTCITQGQQNITFNYMDPVTILAIYEVSKSIDHML